MAYSGEQDGCPGFPRLCELLPEVHSGLFCQSQPLFDLTRSEQVWTWSGKKQAAFEDLKTAVTTAPVLVSPQELDSFWIKVDSLDFATGAVLS